MSQSDGMEGVGKEWLTGWGAMLVDIWREKIARLMIRDTGNLYNSVTMLNFIVGEDSYQASFRFPDYGIYVDRGTGRGFTRGNGGDLGFTPTRRPQEWYSPKFYASFMRLSEFISTYYCDSGVVLIKAALEKAN